MNIVIKIILRDFFNDILSKSLKSFWANEFYLVKYFY